MVRNKHGLPRDIPAPVKRSVRQRCGFGCVLCGLAVFDYEHFNPPFSEATAHDPAGITLLCPRCHAKKTRGWLSADQIAAANESPKCAQLGFSFESFCMGNHHPSVRLGNLVAVGCKAVIQVYDHVALGILPSESPGGPFRLSARFADDQGEHLLAIVDNEWQTPSSHWDVEVVGPRIQIRQKQGAVALALRAEPPHGLVVERMKMWCEGATLDCKEGSHFAIRWPNGRGIQTQAARLEGFEAAIALRPREGGYTIGQGPGGSLEMGSTEVSW